jgi:dihydroflavonol-4-reductase
LIEKGYKVRALLKEKETAFNLHGTEVELYIGDILDSAFLQEAMNNIDYVFHAASVYEPVPFYDSSPDYLYQVNVQGARNVCQAALESGHVKRLIYTSSVGTIGSNTKGRPSDETIPLNYLEQRSHYEKSKKEAEDVVLSFHNKGLETLSINPCFILGKGDLRPTPTGEMIIKFLNGRYPCYFEAIVPLANLLDVVEAHIACIKKGKSGERYIISSPKVMTLKDIFAYMERQTGIKAPTIRLPLRLLKIFAILNETIIGLLGMRGKMRPLIAYELVRYFQFGTFYDSGKARKELGINPQPIENSIDESIAWYVRNGYVKSSRIPKSLTTPGSGVEINK